MTARDLPARVGVLGGGRMGAGIAHAFAIHGCEVSVVEQNEQAAGDALTRIETSVTKSVDRGLVESVSEVMARVRVVTRMSEFAGVDLAIEAVPEDRDLKRDVLSRMEAQLADSGVLATNTSSIPIASLASALRRPERLLGLHFFNPVPASTLIEIVTHPALDPELPAAARAWVESLGKQPITVTDSPGFASSRLGLALALEAIRMVEDGVADPADIDTAMEQGYRHPLGPLRTTDLVGLDVRLGIAEQLEADLGERFAPPRLLREMVARGDIGRKSGRGFYDWSGND